MRFSELPFLIPGNKGWADYEYVATTGRPLLTDRPYVGQSKLVVRLTDSLFPLSDDGETVNMVWSFLDIWQVPLASDPGTGSRRLKRAPLRTTRGAQVYKEEPHRVWRPHTMALDWLIKR